jgi:hypothetical protein
MTTAASVACRYVQHDRPAAYLARFRRECGHAFTSGPCCVDCAARLRDPSKGPVRHIKPCPTCGAGRSLLLVSLRTLQKAEDVEHG